MGGPTYRTEAALLLASLATALALRLHGLYLAGVRLTTVRRDYRRLPGSPQPHSRLPPGPPLNSGFGSEIAIRLPALLAGLAAIPAVFCSVERSFSAPPPLCWRPGSFPCRQRISRFRRWTAVTRCLLLSAILAFLCLHRAIQHGAPGGWVLYQLARSASISLRDSFAKIPAMFGPPNRDGTVPER